MPLLMGATGALQKIRPPTDQSALKEALAKSFARTDRQTGISIVRLPKEKTSAQQDLPSHPAAAAGHLKQSLASINLMISESNTNTVEGHGRPLLEGGPDAILYSAPRYPYQSRGMEIHFSVCTGMLRSKAAATHHHSPSLRSRVH